MARGADRLCRGIIDSWSLAMPWELLAMLVFAASFAQAATGIGFGVIVGPLFIHAYGYDRAVVETALFSLAAAAVCSAKSLRWVAPRFAADRDAAGRAGDRRGAGLSRGAKCHRRGVRPSPLRAERHAAVAGDGGPPRRRRGGGVAERAAEGLCAHGMRRRHRRVLVRRAGADRGMGPCACRPRGARHPQARSARSTSPTVWACASVAA